MPQKIPFDRAELAVSRRWPPRTPSDTGAPVFSTPISERENLDRVLRHDRPLWMPVNTFIKIFAPSALPDNVARGFVFEGFPANASRFGGRDMFGVEWIYVPQAHGSMVLPGTPVLPDVRRWREIKFPDLSALPLAASADANAAYLSDGRMTELWVLNGMFERLVSFCDMGGALISLVDEETTGAVHALFDRLADFYCEYFTLCHAAYGNEIFCFHDDWGSEAAPLFSPDTAREMIAPYIKRVVDCCHSLGAAFNFHSCGRIGALVPVMAEMGVDMWSGQQINDFAALAGRYGDRLCFLPALPDVPDNASDGDIRLLARDFAARFPRGAMATCRGAVDERMLASLYETSRILYSQE